MTGPAPSGLLALADTAGIEAGYWDTRGGWHDAPVRSLLAALRASGVDIDRPDGAESARGHLEASRLARVVDPVTVAWDGAAITVELWSSGATVAGVRARLRDEDGGVRWEGDGGGDPDLGTRHADGRAFTGTTLRLPGGLPSGYHRLVVDHPGGRHEATVIAAPTRVAGPAGTDRWWGVFAPLHALWRRHGTGPDVGDLVRLADWIDRSGGRLVGTLPLLAAFLDRPFDPSPYAPVSRQFWNELYLDLTALPGPGAGAAAARVLATPEGRAASHRLRSSAPFDVRGRAELVRAVLDEVVPAVLAAGPPPAYDAFLARTPAAVDYARFRAAVEARGQGWHGWSEQERHAPLDVSLDDPAVARHLYAQWAIRTQLDDVAAALARRDQRLYLDLPVGSHGDGYDTWRHHGQFAWGMGTGAPPDDFFQGGQNWGFPPLRPSSMREDGHRFFADCLRAHMEVAGVLRLDHVMELHRLYWVPDGDPATDGVYVRYPRQELFAVLAVESRRSGCVVVGEDLGTVPDEIRQGIDRHGLLGMYVLQFQAPADGSPPPRPRHRTMASVNTHDTPTFTGFVRATDVSRNLDDGLIDAARADADRATRSTTVGGLARALAERGLVEADPSEHDLVRGSLALLADSEAAGVLVTPDDLWGEVEPQNVPGTPPGRPNWVHRWPRPLEEVVTDPDLRADLDAVQAVRLASHVRALGAGGGPPE
jgi:4-alpha-glucanotransferase